MESARTRYTANILQIIIIFCEKDLIDPGKAHKLQKIERGKREPRQLSYPAGSQMFFTRV